MRGIPKIMVCEIPMCMWSLWGPKAVIPYIGVDGHPVLDYQHPRDSDAGRPGCTTHVGLSYPPSESPGLPVYTGPAILAF